MNIQQRKKSIIVLVSTFLFIVSTNINAEFSSKVNLTSDYTFNGVSQTENDPAIQASLDYGLDNHLYIGTWASNVDFGSLEDTNIEWDIYAGRYFQLIEKVVLDVGIAYYTYHGDSVSNNYNYPEAYAKLGYHSFLGESELNFWYSWDYFGLDVNHYIAMFAHTVELAPGHNIKLTFDRSTSGDETKWLWHNKDAYNHYRIEYMTRWQGFDFDLALEDTSMNIDNADTRIIFSISRRFVF
ncbi:TorF family putative porin [Colwelliaceae bacterium MEBiC 14330]